MSVSSTSPASFLGGTWERIKDRFLLSAGDTYGAGATGGKVNHSHSLGEGYACINFHWNSTRGNLIVGKTFRGERYIVDKYMLGNAFYSGNEYGYLEDMDAMSLGGNSDSASSMPPYLAVYMWKRTA